MARAALLARWALWALRALGALGALGCSDGAELERLRGAAEPHVERFDRFDAWARRLDLGGSGFGSDAELREAAFAPLRADRGSGRVLAAWLEREGAEATLLAWPSELPPAGCAFRRIRAGQSVIEVCTSTLEVERERHEVVALRRSREAAGGGVLRVTMAFATERAARPAKAARR